MKHTKRVYASNALLRQWYLHLNKKHFGNRLPKDLPVVFSKQKETAGITTFHPQTNRPLYIQINKLARAGFATTMLTLLHEMCHVAIPHVRGHGPRFQAEMQRLAKAGAFKEWW